MFESLERDRLEKLVGTKFLQRLLDAAARSKPPTPEVMSAFADGPEVSGGLDIEPDDK